MYNLRAKLDCAQCKDHTTGKLDCAQFFIKNIVKLSIS